jgi:lathosterol oxidase
MILYFVGSTISYRCVYDKRAMHHPKFLRNQLSMEIRQAVSAMPVMAALTTPFFVAEVRGYTKLYDLVSEAPHPLYTLIQFPFFLAFTDCCIYWIHRALHHPLLYKRLHKPHHKWIVPTPYASYAFHPVDGWSQSVPYHIFPFLFPLQKVAYIGLFVFVTIWTVLIRMRTPHLPISPN